MGSIFVREPNEYVRDQDVIPVIIKDNAWLLHQKFDKSLDDCLEYVKREFGKGGKFELENPVVTYVGKDKVGDQTVEKTSLSEYITHAQNTNRILTPALTIYEDPKVERSQSSLFIQTGVAGRDESKAKMKKADAEGNSNMVTFHDNGQKTKKYGINAISGAHVAESTPLCMPNIHNTLTATCRITTSMANANNEKLIAGNRHYWCLDIAYAAIARTIATADLPLLQSVVTKYGICDPDRKAVTHLLRRSTEQYFRNAKNFSELVDFVMGLKPIERMAFCYIGDMYTLMKSNELFIRELTNKLIRVVDDGVQIPNPEDYIGKLNSVQVVHVGLLCGDITERKDPRAYKDMSPHNANIVAATAKTFLEELDACSDLLTVMFNTDVTPLSQGNMPKMYRRAGVAGDTDSTIFTTQLWSQWYDGCDESVSKFSTAATGCGFLLAYFASENITHCLAQFSRNCGIPDELLFTYQMKSEFYFSVFMTTSRAKTYIADESAKEGLVRASDSVKLDSKGAPFKASKAPEFIRKKIFDTQQRIIETVKRGETICLRDEVMNVLDMENEIYDRVNKGDKEFFSRAEIKTEDAYSTDAFRSPHFHYILWNETFGKKHGLIKDLPYGAIKASLAIKNKTDFNVWLDSMDPTVAEDLRALMLRTGKPLIGTMAIPSEIVNSVGIPPEIMNVIDTDKIIGGIMEPLYIILESLGYYTIHKSNSRIIRNLEHVL